MDKEHFTLLQNIYLKAPIQNLYPHTTIAIKEKEASINMPINSNHLHAAKGMHGSVYFRLLDDAAFFAANSIEVKYFVLTASFMVKFIKPVATGILTAKGIVTELNHSKIFTTSSLYNEENELIALGEGIFIRSKIELDSLTK